MLQRTINGYVEPVAEKRLAAVAIATAMLYGARPGDPLAVKRYTECRYMKLVRWAFAGASAYVVYKYAIGKKAKGEQVFTSPETDDDTDPAPEREGATIKKPSKRRKV